MQVVAWGASSRIRTAVFVAGSLTCLAAELSSQVRHHVLTASEVWRIDGNSKALSRVGWVSANELGEVAVAFPQERQVRIYRPGTGDTGTTIGGPGEGPGEFRILNALGWLGDSLWVSDPGTRRITLFTPDWRVAREIRWPARVSLGASIAGGVGGNPRIVTVSGLVTSTTQIAMVLGLQSDRPVIGRLGDAEHQPLLVQMTVEGAILGIMGRIPGAACWGSSSPIAGQRLCPVFRVGYSPIGSGYVIAGPASNWPRDQAILITKVGQDGGEVYRSTISLPPVPVPESLRDSLAARPRPPGVETTPGIASHLPPVERVVLDRDGRAWIGVPTGPEGGSRYMMLSERGKLSAELRFPGRVTLWDATGERLRGVAYDDDDVPSIVEWRVH